MLVEHNDPRMIDELLSPYRARLLAEGDSWFSMGGLFNTSLLAAISDRNPDWLIVACATSGDDAASMAEVAAFGAYSWLLRRGDGVPPWDALLLSAGGNDLIGRMGLMLDAHGVDDDLLERAVSRLENDLIKLIDRARDLQPGIPIVMHGYDYIVPIDHRRFFRPGPWVGAQMRMLGLPPALWRQTAGIVVDTLGACLDRIAEQRAGVRVVHSAGTLTPGSNDDWANEIHPSRNGYRKLVPKWEIAIQSLLA